MALRSLSTLLEGLGNAVWRADALADVASAAGVALATGHAALDAQLPGGGWPVGALCEILQAQSGLCEWRLLLPALLAVCTPAQRLVLVGAPFVPFGPGLSAHGLQPRALLWVKADALAECLWAAEQALRCAGVAALLVWLPKARSDHLRRLHMAAHEHAKLLFVMRPAAAQDESSPAVLRLLVGGQAADAGVDALQVQVLKRRGPPLAQTLTLSARHASLSVLLALGAGKPGRSDQPLAGKLERANVLDRLAAAA